MATSPIGKAQTLSLIAAALAHARGRRELAAKVRDDLGRLSRLLGAWARGEYTRIPWRTISMAAGALLYFVNPLDAVPDFLVGIGFLDDASVLAMVVASLRGDLERFAEWEKRNAPEAQSKTTGGP